MSKGPENKRLWLCGPELAITAVNLPLQWKEAKTRCAWTDPSCSKSGRAIGFQVSVCGL